MYALKAGIKSQTLVLSPGFGSLINEANVTLQLLPEWSLAVQQACKCTLSSSCEQMNTISHWKPVSAAGHGLGLQCEKCMEPVINKNV